MVSRAKIQSVFLTILLFVVLIPTWSWAVSPNEATVVGSRFITYVIELRGGWGKAKEAYVMDCNELKREGLLLGYHLSIYPHGHIVVSPLKQFPPVKSFSTTCDFKTESEKGYWGLLKDTMQATLLFLQKKYRTLKEEKLPEGISPPCNREAWDWLLGLEAVPNESTIVGPLLDTAWAQRAPFNNYCPMGDGGRCAAGCVAIAAAQIMKYWNHPSSGTGSHSYWWDGDGSIPGRTLSATFSDPYDWGNMLNSYSGSYNDAQAAAVAELCYEVGVAFEMDYGYGGSGAYSYKGLTAFPDYFKYKDSITIEYRSNYGSADDWFERIKEELNASSPRPMMYTISDTDFCHEIVCDGYWEDEIDYIHMNYGWAGSYDNWYAVDNLDCLDGCDYLKEYMLCGIQPNHPPDTPSVPTGPNDGIFNASYTFTASTTDPDADRVAFKFDWGDGTQSGWTPYVDSGGSASKSHSWSSEGTYHVKVKAKDAYNAESGWSAGHPITIRAIVLEVDPSSLDFGELGKSSTATMTFRAYNAGAGTLKGDISVDRNWITVSPTSFEGNDNTISVTVSTEGLTESRTPYIGTVTVTSNGGTKTIEISVIVIPTGVVAYPNPFSLARHTYLTFWGTGVPYAKIRIFNLVGELVKTLDERYGASEVSWDGRNEKGDKVARDIYVYVVKNSTGKIAVVK